MYYYDIYVGLQEPLLSKSNFTFEKAAEFYRTAKASRQQANAIQGQSIQTRTNVVERVDVIYFQKIFE